MKKFRILHKRTLTLARGKNVQRHAVTAAVVLGLMLCSHVMYAQAGNGTAGIGAASDKVKGYMPAIETLLYSIGAVMGFVGAIKVYSKWNAGDQDTQKTAVSWFGSMIFLVVVATVIKGFFGV